MSQSKNVFSVFSVTCPRHGRWSGCWLERKFFLIPLICICLHTILWRKTSRQKWKELDKMNHSVTFTYTRICRRKKGRKERNQEKFSFLSACMNKLILKFKPDRCSRRRYVTRRIKVRKSIDLNASKINTIEAKNMFCAKCAQRDACGRFSPLTALCMHNRHMQDVIRSLLSQKILA